MLARLDGTTRVSVIVGTPIAQVRSPEGITREMQRRGYNGLLVPFEVAPANLAALVSALGCSPSLDGITVTVPHKQAAFACCATVSERARFLGGVNVIRRLPDGTFSGDHVDGESLRRAIEDLGCVITGSRVLLVGAGGAGSAISLSMLEAGAAALAIVDTDIPRRDDLVGRLAQRFPAARVSGTSAPTQLDCDILINATPVGMRAGDPSPIDVTLLARTVIVADVTTPPERSALIAAAQSLGCSTIDGRRMFDAGVGLLADYMLGKG